MRFVLAMAAVAAFAQQLPPPAKPAAPKPGRIEGTVISITGERLPRAQVRYGNYSVTSDDVGKFVLENVAPGRYPFSAQKTGFLTAGYSRSGAGTNALLTLAPDETLKNLTITMTPQAAISGRVTDYYGEAMAGMRVQILRRSYRRGIPQLAAVDLQMTNDVGEYRIANLAPGRYFVSVLRTRQDDVAAGIAAPVGPISTFYPNSPDPQGAAPVELAAGQQRSGVDVRMLQGPVFAIRGKMIPQSVNLELPIRMGVVPDPYTMLPLEHIYKVAPSRSDGSFDQRYLLPGRYTLYAITQGGPSQTLLGSMSITIRNENLEDLMFPLNGGVTVTGSILHEDGSAVPAGRMIVGLEETGIPLAVAPPGQVAKDGTFSIKNAAPFAYRLQLSGIPQGTFVKTATLDGVDAIRNVLDLTHGGGELRIVLAKGATSVTGAVKKEKDQETGGVIVSLWSQEAESGMANQGVYTAAADQYGKFTFPTLRPGTYYAAAWESIDSGLAQTRAFLTQMTPDAVKVEVKQGAAATAEAPLIPKSKIDVAEAKIP